MAYKIPIEKRAKAPRVKATLPCDVVREGEKTAQGITHDLSTLGLCLYLDKPVDIGKTLHLQCGELWDKPKKGVVKWVSRMTPRLFRVGVEFAENKK